MDTRALPLILLAACGGASEMAAMSAMDSGYYSESEESSPVPAPSPRSEPGAPAATPAAKPAAPVFVYTGWFGIGVTDLLPALDAVDAAARALGGHVQTVAGNSVVVRVPSPRFEEARAALAAIGEVYDERIEAYEVSAELTDLASRRELLAAVQKRLLELLARASTVEERLKVLAELSRVTDELQRVESQLATLADLVAEATLYVTLMPKRAGEAAAVRSAVPWVRLLEPDRATLPDAGDVRLALPVGFVVLDREDRYLAASADGAQLRVAEVENDPRGDLGFWLDAIAFELRGRDFAETQRSAAGPVGTLVFDLAGGGAYVLGVQVTDDAVWVVEALLPGPEQVARHRDALLAALADFRGDA